MSNDVLAPVTSDVVAPVAPLVHTIAPVDSVVGAPVADIAAPLTSTVHDVTSPFDSAVSSVTSPVAMNVPLTDPMPITPMGGRPARRLSRRRRARRDESGDEPCTWSTLPP